MGIRLKEMSIDKAQEMGQALFEELATLKATNEKLKDDNDALKAEIVQTKELQKQLAPFKELIEDPVEHLMITVKGRHTCQVLLGRLYKLEPGVKHPEHAEDKDERALARRKVSNLATAMVHHCCTNGWKKFYAEYLSKGL